MRTHTHNTHTHTHTHAHTHTHQADEQYQKQLHMDTDLMNKKHDQELETLRAELDANMRELQEIHVRMPSPCTCIMYTCTCTSKFFRHTIFAGVADKLLICDNYMYMYAQEIF